MPDKTTKLIVALIAAGLWLNAAAVMFHSSPAAAEGDALSRMTLQSMARDISSIASGTCTNPKLC